MVKDTIQVVKEAEDEAICLGKQTEEKQREILDQARRDAASLVQKQNEEQSDYRKRVEQDAKEKNEQVMKAAEEEATKEIAVLRERIKKKKAEAIQLILDTIG